MARGESVIDYAIGSREAKEEIERLEIEGNVDSNHHPAVMDKGKREKWSKEGRRGEKGKLMGMGKGGQGEFIKAFGRVEMGEGVEEGWRDMKERIKRILEKGSEGDGKEERDWWDGECKEGKRRLRRKLRKWRRREGELCREKKARYKRLEEEEGGE